MTSNRFDFDAGALCLDFANTAEWHASEDPQEMLNDISDLIAWGVAAGLLDADQGQAAADWAAARPEAAAIAFDWAIWLREVVYRLFADLAHGGDGPGEELARLNDVLGEAMAQSRIAATEDGYAWSWTEGLPGVALVTWTVARSAAELLTSERLARVKQCADDRGCGYLFVDMSRNRSRRWCSMASCGNRAKAMRHYERSK
jgi:predicted RNA-binding Zn ribbon-like protein